MMSGMQGVGCRTGGMQDKMETGQNGCRKGKMEERSDERNEGQRKGVMKKRNGRIQDWRET